MSIHNIDSYFEMFVNHFFRSELTRTRYDPVSNQSHLVGFRAILTGCIYKLS